MSRPARFCSGKTCITDPETGMEVRLVRYPKGFVNPLHTHNCAHGMYVLEGTLQTHEGATGRAISCGFPKAIGWSMAPPRKRMSPFCSSPTSPSIFTIQQALRPRLIAGECDAFVNVLFASRHSHD